jgi:integrase
MKAKITKSSIDELREQAIASARTIYLWDTELTGFGALATAKGSASYFVEYRIGGRTAPNRRVTFGKHGAVTPSEARSLAKAKLGDVAKGVDVAQVKRDERLRLVSGTFREVCMRYIEREAKPTRHWEEMRRILERDAMPAFGPQFISTITRQQIRARLDAIVTEPGRKPSAERKLYVALMPVFKWAVERGAIDLNPMSDLTRPKPAPRRKRVLDHDEIRALWAAADALDWPFGPFYKLLLLTGARREEVAGMRWPELDLQRRVWRLPPMEEFQPRRTKNGLEHLIDLSPQVMTIIQGLPRMHDGFVFSTTGRTPISGFGRAKERLDTAMEKRLGKSLRPFRVHDIRRTVASLMGDDLDLDQGVIERCLGHLTGTQSGLMGTYQRQQYREKRKQAMGLWGAHVAKIVASGTPDESANVVPFQRLASAAE